MGQILIRSLDEAVIEALRARAARRGRSLEEEARRALSWSAGLDRARALSRLDMVRHEISQSKGRPAGQAKGRTKGRTKSQTKSQTREPASAAPRQRTRRRAKGRP